MIPQFITSAKDLEQVCDALKIETEIAYDTEFIRETSFYPKLELIQVATRTSAWVIDVRAFHQKGKVDARPFQNLLEIFQNPKITKIVHAAFGDQECIYSAFGILPTPIFDTAIAASLAGMGDNIGLSKLLKECLNVDHAKGYARTDWSKRPLSKPVIQYALSDVTHLVQLFDHLQVQLEQRGRVQWARDLAQEFEKLETFDAPPEDIAVKLAQSGRFQKKDFGVLLELVRWREARVRRLDVPRRWIADDGVLIDLAKTKPKTAEQLSAFRGLSKGESKPEHAKTIFDAIERGLTYSGDLPKTVERKSRNDLSTDEVRGIELLKVFMGYLSDREGIAMKHLFKAEVYPDLIRLNPKTPQDLMKSGVVSDTFPSEIAQPVVQFLQGEITLGIKSGALHVVQRADGTGSESRS